MLQYAARGTKSSLISVHIVHSVVSSVLQFWVVFGGRLGPVLGRFEGLVVVCSLFKSV